MTGFALALLICAAFVLLSFLQDRYDRHCIISKVTKRLAAILASTHDE